MTICIIMSAAFVNQELAAEFGPIPPAFLPVGSRPLYEHQCEALPGGAELHLTLPETFSPSPSDHRQLQQLGVAAIPLPDNLSLGEAVVAALNYIGHLDQPVHILHGDTIVRDIEWWARDVVSVQAEGDDYAWAEVELVGDTISALRTVGTAEVNGPERLIATGYFAFESSLDLVRSITRARGDFIEGLNRYAKLHALKPLRTRQWLDFGHLQTFFRGRMIDTTARSFNTLKIDGRTVRKSSNEAAKMYAESGWLRNVPAPIQVYSARLIESGTDAGGTAFYSTAYEYLPSATELFVFCSIGYSAWMRVIASCADFMTLCGECEGPGSSDDALRHLVGSKTTERLELFASQTGFAIEASLSYLGHPMPSLAALAETLESGIDFSSGRRETVMHGDFCFSNILYDSRTRRIRVIDPRGHVSGRATIYGDIRYDLAKLGHSIIGRYDQIICNRYVLSGDGGSDFGIAFDEAPHHRWLQSAYGELVIDGTSAYGADIRAIMISLFLSMLPLHADRPDRQRAFIANALRLHMEFEGRL